MLRAAVAIQIEMNMAHEVICAPCGLRSVLRRRGGDAGGRPGEGGRGRGASVDVEMGIERQGEDREEARGCRGHLAGQWQPFLVGGSGNWENWLRRGGTGGGLGWLAS